MERNGEEGRSGGRGGVREREKKERGGGREREREVGREKGRKELYLALDMNR
jgi:hypothetical protein